MAAKAKTSFSEMFARVKAGDLSQVPPPYVAPTVEYAVCKRCGEKVLRQVEAMECHEASCGIHKARVEDEGKIEGRTSNSLTWSGGDGRAHSRKNESFLQNGSPPQKAAATTEERKTTEDAIDVEPSKLHKSFSTTTMELAETELCLRLSSESRHIFEDDVFQYYERTGRTNVAGWQRYSVSFGAGRMGLEFEYDGKASRRLVVTKVSTEAAALGVRVRDILIGVGHRPVPRGTDPIAVHKHLLSCSRPIVLHFYRLHVRRVNPGWNPPEKSSHTLQSPPNNEDPALFVQEIEKKKKNNTKQSPSVETRSDQYEEEEEEKDNRLPASDDQPSRLASLATAVWSKLPGLTRNNDSNEDNSIENEDCTHIDKDETKEKSVEEFHWPPPTLLVDPERYKASEDDDDAEDENWSCLLSSRHRGILVRSLKPALRPKPWLLVYDSIYDGMSLQNLYNRAARHKGAQLLLVRDDHHHVAGAFVDEPIKCVGDYFGTGECLVFEANPKHKAQSAEEEQNNNNNDDDSLLQVYRWVGPGGHQDTAVTEALDANDLDMLTPPPLPSMIDNDMFVYATSEVLAIGSGGDGEAIRLDEALEFGASRPCATYGTDHSLFAGRDTFPVQRVQLWSFANVWGTNAVGSSRL